MALEVEQRSHIEDDKVEQILKTLTEKFGEPERSVYVTILLKGKTAHGRIRRKAGSEKIVYTQKSGESGHVGREEPNEEYGVDNLEGIKKKLAGSELDKALSFVTERFTFKHEDISVELSRHGVFGNFLEVEVLLDKEDGESQNEAVGRVNQMMNTLGVQVMSGEEYQAHMDLMFATHSFAISDLELDTELTRV